MDNLHTDCAKLRVLNRINLIAPRALGAKTDMSLKMNFDEEFARMNTRPGMYHFALDNEFRLCGGCKHFLEDDLRTVKGQTTSRCALVCGRKYDRKRLPRISDKQFGCRRWEAS